MKELGFCPRVAGEDFEVQLVMRVTPEMQRVLERLCDATGLTVTQLLRRAVALLLTVSNGHEQGLTPALMDAEGVVQAKLTGLFENEAA